MLSMWGFVISFSLICMSWTCDALNPSLQSSNLTLSRSGTFKGPFYQMMKLNLHCPLLLTISGSYLLLLFDITWHAKHLWLCHKCSIKMYNKILLVLMWCHVCFMFKTSCLCDTAKQRCDKQPSLTCSHVAFSFSFFVVLLCCHLVDNTHTLTHQTELAAPFPLIY